MNKSFIKIFGTTMLFFILGTTLVNAGIFATSTNDLGIDLNSIDLDRAGETSKNFLQKIFAWIENWWNSQGSHWVKNIYYKTVEFLNKTVVIK